ncbi:MAG: hypothetical protein CVU44_01780 [Chloroflexi bacterium HGW-Chloroflexi-6]|nr:MAG: hypothetical protein CVU44_01780 [Chloroflexi bacterium HGW-Chloroflexi-6]
MNTLDFSAPLSRYLPPLPGEMTQAWSNRIAPASAWLLDPTAASPRLPVQLAQGGLRVLVTAGNPIIRFLLDLAAHPPTESDLRAALSDLAIARKDDERLELHLQNLYQTHCAACNHQTPVDFFTWDGKSGELLAKTYTCPACGDMGERPANPDDVRRAEQWTHAEGLHRSRALERIAARDDPDRVHAEEALRLYLPRAVYALGTIINRLDGISTSDERRRCLVALILYALDQCNSLWPHETERPRPRQLLLPGVFREHNVWMALEKGIGFWVNFSPASQVQGVAHTLWPEEPPENGGLIIYEGPLREAVGELSEIPLVALAGIIPRPNQAFWTLSALWAGWLWGREAVAPFKGVLRRRRYDWQWHAEALRALFNNLPAGDLPFHALVPELEPDFLSAVILAATTSGWQVESFEAEKTNDLAILVFKKGKPSRAKSAQPDINFIRRVLRETLEKRAAPADYPSLHAAVLLTLAAKKKLIFDDDCVGNIRKLIHTALEADEFTDLEGRLHPETGRWALSKWQKMF